MSLEGHVRDCAPDEARAHTLLRVADPRALVSGVTPPPWVGEALGRAPWVVVRRARPRAGRLPVGVRGPERWQRFAAWLAGADVRACVTPEGLAGRRSWTLGSRAAHVPALAALDEVAAILRAHGLAACWGPAGSVGFELASGCPTATELSDLDLVVRVAAQMTASLAASLLSALAKLAVRADLLLETPRGAVALAEYARACGQVLLRTPDGPRLVVRSSLLEA
jgi:phosphoribosyl-dephospho-CoA transferase